MRNKGQMRPPSFLERSNVWDYTDTIYYPLQNIMSFDACLHTLKISCDSAFKNYSWMTIFNYYTNISVLEKKLMSFLCFEIN